MMQSTRLFCLVFISFSSNRVHSLLKIIKDWGELGTGSNDSYVPKRKWNWKLKRIKEDSDREAVTATMQLKDLSESQDSMQRELVELRQVRDAAQEIAEVMDIPEGDENEPLTLVGKLQKIPKSFERYVSTTTRQYVAHVLGLVKSY